MTGHGKFSASELASLKRRYRALEAPPFLASRIRAGMEVQTRRRGSRRPLLAAMAIAVCGLAVLPFVLKQETAQQPHSMVSLSMGLTSVKLPPTPSLAKLRSVRTPALPPRPVPPPRDQSGKETDVQTRYPKEKTHEVT
jgi:hypothetical protein